jgi:hypothetical protein
VGINQEASEQDKAGLVFEQIEGVGEILTARMKRQVQRHAAREPGDAEQRPEPKREFREIHALLVAMEDGFV